MWLLFDDRNVYVSAICWDSHPERIVANDMRRDSSVLFPGNDNFVVNFDTFHDRRNGFGFLVNAIGGRTDGQITDERWSRDWNAIWDVKTASFENGWTAEVAIPFKSLRYRPGREQTWGFNARRINKWKNEISFLAPIPAAVGQQGLFRPSMAATLVGIEAPAGSKNLEIKPYVTADLTSDLTASPRISNDPHGDAGLDLKYGVTQNLTADFTYNTDFAQVEADEQQVNLTRFSLFFPEKREFFLENQGTFAFGGVPTMFYSRRVGLTQGRAVPIQGGGRMTGRVGRFSLGMLNMQTREEPREQVPVNQLAVPSTNFSVVRVKRDILRRSNIGMIFTRRAPTVGGGA